MALTINKQSLDSVPIFERRQYMSVRVKGCNCQSKLITIRTLIKSINHHVLSSNWVTAFRSVINNGNKKERNSIRSEIKRVINKKNKTKRKLTRRNARQQRVQETRLVYLHKHDVSTVPLPCPITSITRTLSYKCSNRVGDNQSRSRILL